MPDGSLNKLEQAVHICRYIKVLCLHTSPAFQHNLRIFKPQKISIPPSDSIMVYILLKDDAIHLSFPHPEPNILTEHLRAT